MIVLRLVHRCCCCCLAASSLTLFVCSFARANSPDPNLLACGESEREANPIRLVSQQGSHTTGSHTNFCGVATCRPGFLVRLPVRLAVCLSPINADDRCQHKGKANSPIVDRLFALCLFLLQFHSFQSLMSILR